MEMPHPSETPQLTLLTPHTAKQQFRALLPLFAGYWREASAATEEGPDWRDYYRLLRACQEVLDHAPMHPNEAKQITAQKRLECALEVLATTLNAIMPGGLTELESYIVSDLVKERRRQRGLNRYMRAKQRRKR